MSHPERFMHEAIKRRTAKGAGHSRPRRRGVSSCPRKGFTIIEAVAALVILAVAVPPMLWSLREAQAQRANATLASQARWLATEKLEDIIADRHSTTRDYTYVVNANYSAEASVTGFPAFARSVSIVERAADLTSAGTGYKVVTVTVSWDDARSASRSLTLSSVVTDY